jgi:peptidoglycan/LPS O-acetylase OafA/YrhL
MTPFIWILLAVALAWGVLWFFRRRGKQESERVARADKRAKLARADAKAIQRTLDGRR